MINKTLALIALLVLLPLQAFAADLPGSQDYPGIKRFSGSDIVGYTVRGYDEYLLALGNGQPDGAFQKSQKLEGKLTRIVYKITGGHTSLEVLRNYEKALTGAGYQQLFEQQADNFSWAGYFLGKLYYQSRAGAVGGENNPFDTNATKLWRYFAARLTKGDHDIAVAVTIAESNGGRWGREGAKAPTDYVDFAAGDVIVAVDVMEAEAGALDSMVMVKSEDMAKALADKGTVNVYGIYFDTDKSDIKPESTATLDEIAKLLKGDTGLKLKISGHTDSTGDKKHNVDLSLARAAAVVDALTAKYGIDKTRLEAAGYGDSKPVGDNNTDVGRAKNRRVELSKK